MVVVLVVLAVLVVAGVVVASRRTPADGGPGFDPVRPDPEPPSEE